MVTKKFHLDAENAVLFENVRLWEPSTWLKETLHKAAFFPLSNEKTKAERIISPILMEVGECYKEYVTLFSGEELEVNAQEDLTGECDFFFVLAPRKPYLESPIVSLVEAKDEDMEYGLAQCAAQLYGARCYNESEGKEIPVLYGCATTGTDWQFIRFENNTFYIDTKIYTQIQEILGVWHQILSFYTHKTL